MRLDTERTFGKRILLVDDDGALREMLRMLLPKDTFTVVEANNGAEAFALFLGSRFDLVLTDCEMPFVKGNELAVKIRKVAPLQPILMMTAYQKRPGADNPVDAVLNKPFDSARLVQTLTSFLASRGAAKSATRGANSTIDSLAV
jgi:CheY-like chemotaxis protein